MCQFLGAFVSLLPISNKTSSVLQRNPMEAANGGTPPVAEGEQKLEGWACLPNEITG